MTTATRMRGRSLDGRLLLLSALVAAAAAYTVFVLFFQTPIVSSARLLAAAVLFAGLALGHYWFSAAWLAARLREPGAARTIGVALLIVAAFFPLLYRAPAYPLSPLLRPWADLAVQFEVPAGGEPLRLQAEAVKLIMGREALNTSAFQLVGPWQAEPSVLSLAPGETGSLQWAGPVPATVTLEIQPPAVAAALTVYWNDTRTSSSLGPGGHGQLLILEKSGLPWGFNLAFFLSCFVLLAWLLCLLVILLGGRLGWLGRLSARPAFTWLMIGLCVFLAGLTVKLQLDSLNGGMQFITATQLVRHEAVLQGHAPDPWQYRVLSEFVAEAVVRLYQLLGLPAALTAGFISLRVLQNIAIFLLAFSLYRKASASNMLGLLGILLLAASMVNAYYDNDLAFNTYFDLLFYLLCALLLLARRYGAVVIVTVFAALNRETSALIPLLLVGAIVGEDTRPVLRRYMPVLLSLVAFTGIFIGLRLLYSARPLYIPYKHSPGIPLLLYNVTRSFTWEQLFSTLGLVPLLGLGFFSSWPPLWQRWCLVVCPVWFLIHSFASIMAETRLFLVPQALIFVPGVLFAAGALLGESGRAAVPSSYSESGAL